MKIVQMKLILGAAW